MAPHSGQNRSSGAKKACIPVLRDQRLLDAALTHSSCQEKPASGSPDFERLEFLGDSVLNFIVSKRVYSDFGSAREGSLSRYRASVVSRRALARAARYIGLDKRLKLGKSMPAGDQIEEKVLADGLEAMIAAVYLDGGMGAAENFVENAFREFWRELPAHEPAEDPKSALQEFCQKRWKMLPGYSWTETGRGIRCVVSIEGHSAAAEARSKKMAAEKAADLLLKKLRS